jgi:mRNA interferase MazF
MVDKITAVRRTSLGSRVGRVPTSVMVDIERSVVVFLGLAG